MVIYSQKVLVCGCPHWSAVFRQTPSRQYGPISIWHCNFEDKVLVIGLCIKVIMFTAFTYEVRSLYIKYDLHDFKQMNK